MSNFWWFTGSDVGSGVGGRVGHCIGVGHGVGSGILSIVGGGSCVVDELENDSVVSFPVFK